MTSFMMLGLLVSVGLSVLGCGEKSCTLVGCDSGTSFEREIALPAGETTLSISACKNGVCAGGTVDVAGLTGGSGVVCNLTGALAISDCNVFGQAGTTALLRLRFSEPPFTNGDSFQVDVSTPSAPELVKVDESVQYSESFPNGEDCDVTPCKQATIGL